MVAVTVVLVGQVWPEIMPIYHHRPPSPLANQNQASSSSSIIGRLSSHKHTPNLPLCIALLTNSQVALRQPIATQTSIRARSTTSYLLLPLLPFWILPPLATKPISMLFLLLCLPALRIPVHLNTNAYLISRASLF